MLESLELRRHFSISIVNRVLTVTGSGGADTLYAAWNYDPTNPTVRVYDGTTSKVFTIGSNSFDSVSLYGAGGGDTIYAGRIMTGYSTYVALKPVVTNGGAGADTVSGSDDDETIFGGSSDDLVYGNGGWDEIRGENGADTLWGGTGHDILDGTEAAPGPYVADTLYGESHGNVFMVNLSGSTTIDNIMDLNPTADPSVIYIPV